MGIFTKTKFQGGYKFKNFEGAAKPVLHEMPVPEKIDIPLSDIFSDTFVLAVKEGDTLRAGDRIIESNNDSKVSLISPVNGTVSKVNSDRSPGRGKSQGICRSGRKSPRGFES